MDQYRRIVSHGGKERVKEARMAVMSEVMVKVNFDVEPSEKAKEYVRKVVLETMRDLLVDSTWLQELLAERVKELHTDGS
jgi:hypothetical protein